MSIFKCKMCGGTLEVNDESVAVCEYCGTKQTLPKLDDDRRANLYDRANHFRRNNDFDKAMGIYEQILNEDNADAEAYWSLVLCRYGIEYVEDPASHKRIPTVNRAQFTSIFDDEDYKSALQYADVLQREVYESEASAINEIQKGILTISQKEEPFDVFICYKETDNNGRRTQDSVLATELYHELTREGFKVFFSRITLEDKLGVAYEPYIFAALNSAKVMVVLGTRPEHFNAVWVKNEWSRYLALIKNGAKKTLIPAYRDMDPYDLPEEFSHLQAQDMAKLGFMQDLVRGITKIAEADAPKVTVKESVKETVVMASNASGNTAALMKRGLLALEDGEWAKADEFFEQVLNMDAENAQAYLGKLMAELEVEQKEDLADCDEPFDDNGNYEKVLRFGDEALKNELKGYIEQIVERNELERLENIYSKALSMLNSADTADKCRKAEAQFRSISGYKDADSMAEQSIAKAREITEKAESARKDQIYASAVAACDTALQTTVEYATINSYEEAIKLFASISGWKDADKKAEECRQTIKAIQYQQEQLRLENQRKAELARIEAEKRRAVTRKRVKWASIIIAILLMLFAIGAFVVYWSSPASVFEYEKAGADSVNIIGIKNEARAIKDGVLEIPDEIWGRSVTYIGPSAFSSSEIKQIILPKTLISIDSSAFSRCINLNTIEYVGSAEEWGKITGTEGLDTYTLKHRGQCSFSEWADKEAYNCTQARTEVRYCLMCKTEESREAAARGHVEETIVAKAPTCTETGLSEGKKCTVCDEVTLEQEVVEATGHTVVADNAVKATCTTAGKTEGSHCSVCDAVITKQETVKALGHSYGEGTITVQPTCTTEGKKESICTICEENRIETIEAIGHKYKDIVCTVCSYRKPSDGLEFKSNNTGYTVTSFGTCKDKDLVIPETYNGKPVTKIGDYAFEYCDWITSVTIPSSITAMGENAFRFCNNIQKVYITDLGAWCRIDNLIEGPMYRGSSDGVQLYINGKLETDVIIPETVNELARFAFDNCSSIKNITISEGVKSLGLYSIHSCENLETVTIPVSVTEIDACFNFCPSLTKVYYAGTRSQWGRIEKDGDMFYRSPVVDIICSDGNLLE